MQPGGGTDGPDAARVGTFRSFAHDLRRVGRVWRRDRRLPVTVVAVGCLTGVWELLSRATGVGAFTVAGLIATIYLLGFVGTNLVWCVRVDRGARMPWPAVVRITREVRWRYFWLYVLITLVGAIPMTVAYVVLGPGPELYFGITAIGTVAFALFTFAFPAIAFDAVRARDAVRHSLTVLRHEWPGCAAYVVLPPLVAIIAMLPRAWGDHAIAAFGIGLVVGVVRAVLDGAIALFYADRYPTLRGGDAVDDADLREVGTRHDARPPAPLGAAPVTASDGTYRRDRPHRRPPRGHDQPLRTAPGAAAVVSVWQEPPDDRWFARCRLCDRWVSRPEPSRKAAHTAFLRHQTEAHGAPTHRGQGSGTGIPLRREAPGGSPFRPPAPPSE